MSQLELAQTSLGRLSARRRRRSSVTLLPAGLVVGLAVLAAVFGPLLAPHDPNAQDLLIGLQGPSRAHLLGTDILGRDIFSRMIVGARPAIGGPLVIAIGAMAIGNLLGLVAGFFGGFTDSLIMRWTDLVYALPALLVAIVVVGVIGGGYARAVALLVILYSPVDTRIVRAATLEQRGRPYVEAARAMGLPARRIMARHIWPNVVPLALANAFLTFAFSLVSLASLSFLGLGVGPGTADWGRMLSEGRALLFDNPAAALAPGVAIVMTAASVNLIGDWIAERLAERGGGR
jgi:peptide/nickel transport system permease protein